MEKKIQIENKHFKIYVLNEVLFVERTDYKCINDEYGDIEDPTGLWEDAKNPKKIINTIVFEIIGLIKDNKITYFKFSAIEDSRRTLYDRLAKKIAEKLNFGYHIEVCKYESIYYFYKIIS